jgi:hypothetical protein
MLDHPFGLEISPRISLNSLGPFKESPFPLLPVLMNFSIVR